MCAEERPEILLLLYWVSVSLLVWLSFSQSLSPFLHMVCVDTWLSRHQIYIFTGLPKGPGHKFSHKHRVIHTNSIIPGMFLICPLSTLPGSTWGSLGVCKSHTPFTGGTKDWSSCFGGRKNLAVWTQTMWSLLSWEAENDILPLVSLVYTLPKCQSPSSLPGAPFELVPVSLH